MDRGALQRLARQLIAQGQALEKMLAATEQPSLLDEPKKKPDHGAINIFQSHHILVNMLVTVTWKAQQSWVAAYPSVTWLKEEILKANSWIQCNPQKAPKNLTRFISTWLLKAHESYRKGLPSSHLKPSVYRGPTGGPPPGWNDEKTHPGGQPLKPELKKALDLALKRTPTTE